MPKDLVQLLSEALKDAEQNKAFKDVDVERKGHKIIMPEGMSHKKAIEWHMRMMEEEEKEIGIVEHIEAYPLDGALALMKALKTRFGWTSLEPERSFFGSNPPTMVGLEVAMNKKVQVPWGRIAIPGVAGYLVSGLVRVDGRRMYSLQGKTQMRHKDLVHQIAEDIRKILAEESIYKGAAIRVQFPDVSDDDDTDDFDPTQNMPKFMDVNRIQPSELIFSKGIDDDIQNTLWTPIEKTDLCRQAGIPLKRGFLFEGPYGTGKTMAANVTARICVENGWTFIYITDVNQLNQAMHFARMYQPAVIFAEDFDQTEQEDNYRRTSSLNEVLNTIDGIGFKHSEIMVVLTTNHVERISQAMLRPGRLDTIISVRAPDAEAVERLIKLYGRGMLDMYEDVATAAKKLEGQIPAIIREVVERSKLAAITRNDTAHITASDLNIAADGMVRHLELLKEKKVDARSDMEKAAAVLAAAYNEPSKAQ